MFGVDGSSLILSRVLTLMTDAYDDAAIKVVKAQYLQQIPPRAFKWPETLPLIQRALWENVLL